MGCNNSRLHASEEEIPHKIRPLLLRRFEELRKRHNGGGGEGGEERALSKVHLLNGDHDDDTIVEAQSLPEDETNNMFLPKGIQSTNKEQNMVHVDKLSKVVPLPVSEYVENNGDLDFQRAENKHDDDDDNEYRDEDDDDDDDEEENNKERLLGRGSPSFKIYINHHKIIKEKERENCITSIENKKSTSENQNIAMHQKSPSSDSYQSAASQNSGSSNEGIERESSTKRRRHKMNFGAVKKNLLNVKQVKHRMNPMFSRGGNDIKTLLSHK